MKTSVRLSALAGVGCLAPTLAFAHPEHGGASLLAGLEHPVTGADHLLAMIAVGFWAASLGGRARWSTPAAFVAAMAIGAFVGGGAAPLMEIEAAIAASIAALGLLIAFDIKPPTPLAAALVALFALAHGAAHGAEAPAGSFAAFSAGFVASTAALHGVGLGLGALRFSPAARRVGGLALTACGFWFALAT